MANRKIPFRCQYFRHDYTVLRSRELYHLGIVFRLYCRRCSAVEDYRFPAMPMPAVKPPLRSKGE